MKWHTNPCAIIIIVLFSAMTATATNIEFADPETKRICLENFDSNGDGKLTNVEAESVTSLRGKFRRADITSFDELKYFTNLWYIGYKPHEGVINPDNYDEINQRGDFYNCTKLKSIIIPNNVTFIGTKAFYGCRSLKSIEIPSKVTQMSEDVFQGCTSLRKVTTKVLTPPKIYKTTFPDRTNIVLIVPKGCVEAYKKADYWKEFMFITDNPESNNTSYIALSQDGTQATFYYDKNMNERQDRTIGIDSYTGLDDAVAAGVKKVVFDPSFALAKPTSIHKWFYGMSNLSTIEGLRYLDTSEVADMSMAFCGCTNLATLDVSRFDTSKATNMHSMFLDCSTLRQLDLSNFDTSKAFITDMFLNNCTSLDSLAISNTMGNLNDNAFISVGTEASPCAIYFPEDFYFGVGDTNDVFSWKSGWFYIDESSFDAYFVQTEDMKSIAFYYDNRKNTRIGYVYNIEEYISCGDIWSLLENPIFIYFINKVTFTPSFAKARLPITKGLFEDMEVETIEGMEYLNTTEVSDMGNMFKNCTKLKNIDLSHFDTSNVTNMAYMFGGCSSLQNLDLSSFNTAKVTHSSYMLNGCSNLNSLAIGSTMGNLEENTFVNLGTKNAPCLIYAPEGFDFGVDTSGGSFQWKSGWFRLANEKSRAYLVVSPDGKEVTFFYDNKKNIRQGTAIDINDYEGLDTDAATLVTKVVFNPSFAEALPTSTKQWLKGMSKLASIEGMEYLNTKVVMDMSNMFNNCAMLTSIDLSHFDTSNVTTMYAMFSECTSLKNLDVSNFNTSKVTNMYSMFKECTAMKTLDLSNFDTSKATNTSYMFDNCHSLESIIISGTMGNLNANAFNKVGTEETPCLVTAPEGFDFGVDTSGGSFLWKGGWFWLGNTCILTAEAGKLLAGGTASLVLSLENGQQGISAIQCQIVLPGGVTIATEGNNFLYTVAERCRGSLVQVVETMDGHYNLMMFHFSDESFSGSSGPIITLTLKADEDLSDMESEGRIDYIVLTNTAREMIEAAPVTFPITVSNYLLGDVNHDGYVNVVDVMMTVDYVLVKMVKNFNKENADVNGDGSVDVSDVMGIVNIVLYTIPSNAPALATSDKLTATPTTSGVTLRLDNASRYTAMEMTVEIPQGAILTRAFLCNPGDHHVKTHKLGNGLHRMVVYSISGETLSEGDALLHLDITGGGDVKVSDIVLANTFFETLSPQEATGIIDLAGEANDAPTYDIQGWKVTSPNKGVYIQKNQKVVVK